MAERWGDTLYCCPLYLDLVVVDFFASECQATATTRYLGISHASRNRMLIPRKAALHLHLQRNPDSDGIVHVTLRSV